MKLQRLLVAIAAIALPAGLMIACSSKQTTTTSGGARFRFQGAASATAGACPDPTIDVTIATTGDDGKAKLIPDGTDGSNVSCAYNADQFTVTVQGNRGFALTGSGHFNSADKMTSTDATMQFIVPGATYRSASGKPCTITFQRKDSNALLGRIVCAEIDHNSIPGAECGVTSFDTDGFTPYSYFQFADCTDL